MNPLYYTERQGILVDACGNISLRHEGQLRQIKAAVPLPPAKENDPDPAWWGVMFTDETTARISRLVMNPALTRRMMETPASVLFPDSDKAIF